jgi:anti-sigma B factor antagonist
MRGKLKTRTVGNVVIITLSGPLQFGESTLMLRTTIRRHLDDGNLKFVIDVGGVSQIDSAGLGELVATYTTIRDREGDVKLVRLTERIEDLLQVTKLLTVFDCLADEAAALAALDQA